MPGSLSFRKERKAASRRREHKVIVCYWFKKIIVWAGEDLHQTKRLLEACFACFEPPTCRGLSFLPDGKCHIRRPLHRTKLPAHYTRPRKDSNLQPSDFYIWKSKVSAALRRTFSFFRFPGAFLSF